MKMSLFISLLCYAASYSLMAQAVCTPAPNCASLGYILTAADCEGLITVKCPSDTSKVFCNVPKLPILYGDGTVATGIVTGKTPIGIVFDKENRLAVALTDAMKDGTVGSTYIPWSSNECDTPELQNCSTSEISTGANLTPITCGVDGRLNTNAILASSCISEAYAAIATNNYQPSGCTKDFCKKTKWFLPRMRDLQNIYLQKTQINATLNLANSYAPQPIKDSPYYSSTEYNALFVWIFYMNSGIRAYYSKTGLLHVRPIIVY